MKKVMVGLFVILGIVVIAGCGNSEGKEAYKEFKERYAIDFSDADKLDDWPVSIYKAKSAYYVKVMKENKYDNYYSWNAGTSVSDGRSYEAKSDFNVGVGNAEPIYEQNMN